MKYGVARLRTVAKNSSKTAGNPPHAGFTIMETLIVLSITGVLFFSFVTLISGRKATAEFRQAANNLKVQIEQVIHEVQSGNYPGLDDFSCVNSGGSLAITNNPADKGTNKQCIFLGKAIQFGVVESAGAEQDTYQVYTIAGARTFNSLGGGGERLVQTLDEAIPKLVAPGQAANTTVPNRSERATFENGLTPVSMRVVGSGGASQSIGAVAFVTSFEPGASDGLMTGSQTIQIIGIESTSLGRTAPQGVDSINSLLTASYADSNLRNPAGGVRLCMASGTNSDRSALLTIGGDGKTASVGLDIKTTGDCS